MNGPLKDLLRIPVPPDFKQRVQDRLGRSAPRRRWGWSFHAAIPAAAAGILLGFLLTLSPGTSPASAAAPNPEIDVKEHARRTGLFLMAAAQTEDPQVLSGDYAISGLDEFARRVSSLPPGAVPADYVERVVRPLCRLGSRIRRGDVEAVREAARLAGDEDVWRILEVVLRPRGTPEAGSDAPPDQREFWEARRRLYGDDVPGATRRFDHFAQEHPDSRFVERWGFGPPGWHRHGGDRGGVRLGEGWLMLRSAEPGEPAHEAWRWVAAAYPEDVRVTPGAILLNGQAWARIAQDPWLSEAVSQICARYPLAAPAPEYR